MSIIRYRFIDKSVTNEMLQQFVNDNFLTVKKYHVFTMYHPQSNIYEEIHNFNYEPIINQILNIKKEHYMTSAIFFNVIKFLLFSRKRQFFFLNIIITLSNFLNAQN